MAVERRDVKVSRTEKRNNQQNQLREGETNAENNKQLLVIRYSSVILSTHLIAFSNFLAAFSNRFLTEEGMEGGFR